MGDDSRDTVVVQDPMMEYKSNNIVRMLKKDLKKLIEHLSKN
jgi:hypothetical protein